MYYKSRIELKKELRVYKVWAYVATAIIALFIIGTVFQWLYDDGEAACGKNQYNPATMECIRK